MANTPYKEKFDEAIAEFKKTSAEFQSNYANKCNEIIDKYSIEINELDTKVKTLSDITTEGNSILENIKELQSDASESLAKIKETYNRIHSKDGSEMGILPDILDSQKCAQEIYDKLESFDEYVFGKVIQKKEQVPINIYSTLAESARLQEGNIYYKIEEKTIPGLEEKLKKIIDEYSSTIQEIKTDYEKQKSEDGKKRKELLTRIENLLPGATASGLAGAYYDAKKESGWRIIFWSCGFIASLIAFAVVALTLIRYNVITFTQEMTFQSSVGQLMRAACFELPCIWFAWAANVKVSQYTRLNEEYRHKWAMMRVFDGMRNALEETEDAKEENNVGYFYRVLLDSFSNNPSKTLDKKYSPDGPFSIFDKMLKKTEKDADDPKSTNNPQ